MADLRGRPEQLSDGATIAIIGGGPAGSFAAIHLLSLAQTRGRRIRVVVFERRRHRAPGSDEQPSNDYSGCPKCAGGISPRFNEALERLEISVPPQVMQARIKSITVQGNWKHIYLPVPEIRRMISVYRGALPFGQDLHHYSFDSLLLDCATGRGAELVGGRVIGARFDEHLKPVVQYESDGRESELKADFAIFAGGVNEKAGCRRGTPSVIDLFRMLQPRYEPPALRKALIFELEAPGHMAEMAEGDLHFIESSVDQLHLDMCSILPKRGFFTVSLIGRSVDESQSHRQNMAVIGDFLALPQIRRTLPPVSALRVRCVCNPSIVIGSARWPLVGRAAAVGDMATSRQYKGAVQRKRKETE